MADPAQTIIATRGAQMFPTLTPDEMARLRRFIEVLVDFVRFAPGFSRRKNPGQDSHVSRFASLLHRHGFTMYLGGAASDTPTY